MVPSVTSVIAMIAKPKLTGWAARTAAQYAVDNWEELSQVSPAQRVAQIRTAHEDSASKAAQTGNAVHEVIDKWSKGEPADAPKDVSSYVRSFISFMLEYQPRFLATEVTVWSRQHAYAGTADAVVELDGKIVLLDAKTGKRVYPEVGLQLSALRHAEFIITELGEELPMPPIEAMAALHIRPRSWKLIPVEQDNSNWSSFLAAREIWDWVHCSSADVLAA
jgi:hypothetical protein